MSITKIGAWKTADGRLHETAEAAAEWETLGPLDGLNGKTLYEARFERGAVRLIFPYGDPEGDRIVWFRAIIDAGVPKLVVHRG